MSDLNKTEVLDEGPINFNYDENTAIEAKFKVTDLKIPLGSGWVFGLTEDLEDFYIKIILLGPSADPVLSGYTPGYYLLVGGRKDLQKTSKISSVIPNASSTKKAENMQGMEHLFGPIARVGNELTGDGQMQLQTDFVQQDVQVDGSGFQTFRGENEVFKVTELLVEMSTTTATKSGKIKITIELPSANYEFVVNCKETPGRDMTFHDFPSSSYTCKAYHRWLGEESEKPKVKCDTY